MKADDKGPGLAKTAFGVLFGFILMIILLNIPGILIRNIALTAAGLCFLFAGYNGWMARSLGETKRRMSVTAYVSLGLVALLIAVISWSTPLTTPIPAAFSIGLLTGGALGVTIIYLLTVRRIR